MCTNTISYVHALSAPSREPLQRLVAPPGPLAAPPGCDEAASQRRPPEQGSAGPEVPDAFVQSLGKQQGEMTDIFEMRFQTNSTFVCGSLFMNRSWLRQVGCDKLRVYRRFTELI